MCLDLQESKPPGRGRRLIPYEADEGQNLTTALASLDRSHVKYVCPLVQVDAGDLASHPNYALEFSSSTPKTPRKANNTFQPEALLQFLIRHTADDSLRVILKDLCDDTVLNVCVCVCVLTQRGAL